MDKSVLNNNVKQNPSKQTETEGEMCYVTLTEIY